MSAGLVIGQGLVPGGRDIYSCRPPPSRSRESETKSHILGVASRPETRGFAVSLPFPRDVDQVVFATPCMGPFGSKSLSHHQIDYLDTN
jgi:hypothetical protein